MEGWWRSMYKIWEVGVRMVMGKTWEVQEEARLFIFRQEFTHLFQITVPFMKFESSKIPT